MSDKVRRWAQQYPEFRLFPTKDDAERAYKDWKRKVLHEPKFWLSVIGFSVILSLLTCFVLIGLRPLVRIPTSLYGGIVGGVVGGSTCGFMVSVWRPKWRLFLRRRLIACGVPVCVACGCDLRGQMTLRCPRCGISFDAAILKTRGEHLA